ncbi:MAG: DNA polymerase III subunit gamma/tau, partial [Acidobacteriota bacterium]|nr:DNA polymerase III subunit gamma/tau [Acidobacteriota bacterium]
MSYQVIARKWRPQRFDEVVGQHAVTRTLKNAIASGRIAQAFVFAGPRGVGKTTTARILARALNCVHGPTVDPCGTCDACVEIAEGRDIDVLEIDAATHTKVETVREVIIGGLSLAPVRDRYKVFIIDEVHQLSTPSFNALLKSIEEPPPHVAFIMATTELPKIPETILSRSQVYEFRTIPTPAIAAQLRTIADAEGIVVSDEALALVARGADGSMRDAQSAFDQVIAYAGQTIGAEDVSTVLGLVGRDLLLDTVQAVADEDASMAFAVAGRAVEAGYDLRVVCRELTRVVRDLLVLSVDPTRAGDPDIAPEGEAERLQALAARFSREDLLRAFDVLSRAEFEIRNAAQPRYYLEMALLRWIHLRQLTPLADLIDQMGAGGGARPAVARPAAPAGSAASVASRL